MTPPSPYTSGMMGGKKPPLTGELRRTRKSKVKVIKGGEEGQEGGDEELKEGAYERGWSLALSALVRHPLSVCVPLYPFITYLYACLSPCRLYHLSIPHTNILSYP